MGHHKEDELNGHHHSSDDSSDDDGHSLRKPVQKKDSPKTKESHDEISSSSSSFSSSSSSSSRKIASHLHKHHHGDDDDGARALGEEDVVSLGKDGAEGNAPGESLDEVATPATIEEDPAINRVEEIDQGLVSVPETDERKVSEEGGPPDRFVVEREEGNREESEVSDAPVYDKFLVENSLKEDQKVKANVISRSVGGEEASSDKQGSRKKRFDVVRSETLEGIHDVEKCDAPEFTEMAVVSEPVEETAKSEASEEPVVEESSKGVFEESNSRQSSVSEEQAAPLSDLEGSGQKGVSSAIMLEGEGDGRAEKSASEETEEELVNVEIEANGIALEGDLTSDGPTNLEDSGKANELSGKSGHDNLLEGGDGDGKEPLPIRSHRDLSVELGSPLEHPKRFTRQFMTPSPPKRQNSVYKIVLALEGSQVGEKCIHGEIDHGVCHQRYGDRRTSSPSFSSRAYRETSPSPKTGNEGATPESKGVSAEVRVSDGQKREVDSDWSLVQHDSHSGVTTHQTATIKTETYTDTVLFRRDDGFLPRTPGRSPLSGSQSMRAVFNQVDASGPSTPTLKIVHEFPSERDDGVELQDGASTSTLAGVEGESEVERILRLQDTHDLVCPVCSSCITKRVILRKRKRTTVTSTEKWEAGVLDEEEENTQGQAHDDIDDGDTVVEQYEDYGCLGCFTFLFRRERSVQRTQIVDVPGAVEAAASISVAPTSQTTDQSAVRLPEPVAVSLTNEDFDNRCLPIFFTWRQKTTSPTDAEIVAPLLSKEEKKTLAEESSVEVLRTQSRDVPAGDLPFETQQPAASELQQSPASEIQPPPASEILELPAAPGAVGGVQLPVVVVESREDRLCFPFLWRRASKTTQVQSELIQPLLAKGDVKHQSEDVEDQSTEIKQQSDEVKQQSEDVEQRTEVFTRIEDDLWMRREVLLEVPVSVPPQETLITPSSSRAPDSSETAAESDTSFKAIRVTEAERRVDCLCFPSWSSSETTSEETEALLPESRRATNSLQGAVSTSASGTEPTEQIQTSDSVTGSESTEYIQTSSVLKEVASVTSGHEAAEIILTSPSLRGAVSSVAPITEDREVQTAGFNCMNCMDILVPSYPWGPPGTGSRKEVLERAEERSASATSTQFEFSTVGQVVNKDVVILPEQVVSESFTNLNSQVKKPQEVFPIQTTTGSAEEPESQSKESQGVMVAAQIPEESGLSKNEISTSRREDSRCLPLLLPTISWRRQELKNEEILGQSSKSKTTEIESSMTSENKSSVDLENNLFVALERKSSGAAEAKLPREKEVEREIEYGDVEVSRNLNQQREQISNDIAAEVVDEEEVPLVRKPPMSKTLTPSKVEALPAEEGQRLILPVEIDDSSLSEVLESDISYSKDLSRTPSLPTVLPVDGTYEEETREKGSWNSCLPSHSQLASQSSASQDVTTAPSSPEVLRPVYETYEEERREKESWSCCLPSYTQLAYQPIEDRETGEQAAPASSGGLLEASVSPISEESKSIFHEEVARETTIDARITTQTTTTKSHTDATNGETIDGVRIDTSVSYVQASVQHDEGAVEGKLHLDDHPTFSLQPSDKLPVALMLEADYKPVIQPPLGPTYSTGYAALARFLEDEEELADEDAAVNERLADLSQQGVSWKDVELFKPVSDVEQDRGEGTAVLSDSFEEDTGEEIIVSEAVTKVKVPAILSDSVKQDIGREIARGGVRGAQVEMLGSFQDEDEYCCLPKSKWLWGRPKLTYGEASLREPLLGRDSAQQHGQEGRLQTDSEVDSKSDTPAHVTIQQIHEVTHTTTGSTAGRVSDEEECNCFPWSSRYNQDSTEVDTTVTVTSDDMVIEVEGTDVTSTLAAARAAAEDAGMMDEQLIQEPEYLKSIVFGGLDVSLTSLGVVASAAGGDAKTRNVLALGLANLIFGFIAFLYKIQDLHKESPARFQGSVGPRFWINGPLAMISFLFFGALPVLTFGFSFRELNDHDYKMAATVLVSIIAVIFLGCGKVAAKMTELSYRRTLTTLVSTGILAAVAGFYTGEYISKLLAKDGILDE